MKRKNHLFFSLVFCFFCFVSFAQESENLREPNKYYRDALDLFDKKEYASAQKLFEKIIENETNDKKNASVAFYRAACSYHLNNNDAFQLLTYYVENFQTASDINKAYFLIGNELFDNKKYKQVIENYEKSNPLRLNKEDVSQYFFNKGYSYLMIENYKNAEINFNRIKRGSDSYATKARFYSASLAYQNEQFETARSDFETLKNNKEFSKQVELYLIDINHKTQEWSKVVQYNDDNMSNLSKKEKTAITAMKIDAYFNQGDYDNSLKYMEKYETTLRGVPNRTMQYQYGYILYQKKDYKNAIEKFNKVVTENDSMTQSAYNLIGYSYVELDNKREAQRAFYSSYQVGMIPPITEESMFNYVKLACDISYDPYRKAFTIINNYIEQNPNGSRVDEAYILLVNLSVSTNNYAEAIEALAKINNKTKEISKVEQNIQYLHAINLFNAQNYKDANYWFQKANQNSSDILISAKSSYWIAEANYRQKLYSLAETEYKKFQKSSAAKSLPYFNQVNYHLGYINYDQKRYSDAIVYFEQFISNSHESVLLLKDAYNRLGDCHYILKQYAKAIDYYEMSLQTSGEDGDYSLFQKALCLGALEKYNDKIQSLNQLIRNYPKSPLVRDDLYETAITYLFLNNSPKALDYFDKVIKTYPYTMFAVKSTLRKGLILYGQDKNQEALVVLKQLVDKSPETSEAQEALKVIENIYLSMNKVDEYIAYTSTVRFADLTNSKKDSLAYFSAENLYIKSNYMEAVPVFQAYLEDFPEGIFSQTARNYLADCAMHTNQQKIALEQYEILAQIPSERNKTAIEQAATMNYKQGNYEKALKYFKSLRTLATQTTDMIEPTVGMMNCYEKLEDLDSLSIISFELLSLPNVPKPKIVQAHNNIAFVALQQQNIGLAKREFQVVSSLGSGEQAAKANYFLASILYAENNYDAAMESTFDLINDFPNEDYWVVSSFLLLSDIYLAKDNEFQAEQTLNSIIENTTIESLKNQAIEKLNHLKSNKSSNKEEE